MSFPLLHLAGSPYEQGRRHGAALREAIGANLALYLKRFREEAHLAENEVFSRAVRYGAFVAARSAAYAEGMQGIAEGSGFSRVEILVLNLRYELLYDQFSRQGTSGREGPRPRATRGRERTSGGEMTSDADPACGGETTSGGPADGCTAFALCPQDGSSGHLVMGQNWDWIPEVQGAVLATVEPDGLLTLGFTEAGIFGPKIGLNSAGLGLCINGMNSIEDDWSHLGTPFHARCYEIIRSATLERAATVLRESPHSCSANFLLASAPDSILDVETGPGAAGAGALAPKEGPGRIRRFVHTNHFLDPQALGIHEPQEVLHPRSRERCRRMQELLASRPAPTEEDLKTFLADHEGRPDSICRHRNEDLPPAEHYATVASILIDLHAREMAICKGRPCHGTYVQIRLR